MALLKKSTAYFQKLTGFFSRKTKTPEYTGRQIIFKMVQIVLSAFVFDLASAKISTYEMGVYWGTMMRSEAYGPYFLYLCAITGFFIANGFWRLMELYWWGKSQCEGRIMNLHSVIEEQNQMIQLEPR